MSKTFFDLPKEIGKSEEIRIIKAGKKNHPGKFGDISFFDIEHNGQELALSVKSGGQAERICDENIGGVVEVTSYFDEEHGQRRYTWKTLTPGKAIAKSNPLANGNGGRVTRSQPKEGCDITTDDVILLGAYLDRGFKKHGVSVGTGSHISDVYFRLLGFEHKFTVDREFLDSLAMPDADIPFD